MFELEFFIVIVSAIGVALFGLGTYVSGMKVYHEQLLGSRGEGKDNSFPLWALTIMFFILTLICLDLVRPSEGLYANVGCVCCDVQIKSDVSETETENDNQEGCGVFEEEWVDDEVSYPEINDGAQTVEF